MKQKHSEEEVRIPMRYRNWIVGTIIKTPTEKKYYATYTQFFKRMLMIAYESLRHGFNNYDVFLDEETGDIKIN